MMYVPNYMSVRQLLVERNHRQIMLYLVNMVVLLLVFGLILLLVHGLPGALPFIHSGKCVPPIAIFAVCLLLIVVCLVPILIWYNPRLGLFALFTATTFIDMDPRALNTHKLTAYLPLFININNVAEKYHLPGMGMMKFSIAEVLIALTLFFWIVRTISRRKWQFETGPFLLCLSLYAVTTFLGFLHGYVTGGDAQMGLWEVRAKFYPIIMYILTMQLVDKREHVIRFLWIAFWGLGLLSIVGVISYFQLQGVVGEQGILDHEDSLILNIAIFLVLFTYLGGGNKKMLKTGLLFLPTIIFTMLENQRRAGIAAFVIAFVASLPLMYAFFTEKRKLITRFIVFFALFGSVYVAVGWNAEGAWALPARAIRSNFSPSDRDAGSDMYRKMEDADLKYTRDLSPLFGFGYGKPFVQIWVLPAVSTQFLAYFAHDSVLWVWMRTGHVGFFCFMLFIATVMIRGMQIAKETTDPDMRTVAMMTVFFLLMAYVYGKYDLQLTNYRTMMMLGIWLGLLGRIPLILKSEAAQSQDWSYQEQEAYDLTMPSLLGGDAL